MTVVVIDARDSFVHILADFFDRQGVPTRVVRPDLEDAQAAIEQERPGALVLGPGPGHPARSCHVPLVQRYLGRLPVLGVCLGHQALGLHLGWPVERAPRPQHGKRSPIHHDGEGLFGGLASPMHVARYHSLVVAPPGGHPTARVVARAADDGTVMALEDRTQAAWGVQFHPESHGTATGQRLIANFCELARLRAAGRQEAPGGAGRLLVGAQPRATG